MRGPRAAAGIVCGLLCSLALISAPAVAGQPVQASDLDRFDATKVCSFADDRLDEISGIALSLRHPDILWLHNDSGGGPYIYAVDARTCDVRARITIAGAQARDFEAMAVGRDPKGRPVLWLGDIGDNLEAWPSVRILRVREPARIADATIQATTFDIKYADGPHNAEALLADPNSGRLWIVTKKLASGGLYELPRRLSATHPNTATFVRRERGLVTDGAISPDGARYVLRDYVDATIFGGLPPGRDPRIVAMPFERQGEAIAWTADGQALLIASEGDRRLLRVPVAVVDATYSEPEPSRMTPTQEGSAEASASSQGGDQHASGEDAEGLRWQLVAAVGLLVMAAGAVIAIAEWRRRASRA